MSFGLYAQTPCALVDSFSSLVVFLLYMVFTGLVLPSRVFGWGTWWCFLFFLCGIGGAIFFMLLPLDLVGALRVGFVQTLCLVTTLSTDDAKVVTRARSSNCFLRAVAGKRDLCSVTDVCGIAANSVIGVGPNDSRGVGANRALGVPRGGVKARRRVFRAVRSNRALCGLARHCKMATRHVYRTGPKLDTRGFHVKRIVMVPTGIASDRRVVVGRIGTTRAAGPIAASAPLGPGYESVRGIRHGRAVFDVDHLCNVARTRLVTTGPRLHARGLGGKEFLYVPCPGSAGARAPISGAPTMVPASSRLFGRDGGRTHGVSAVGTTMVLPFVASNGNGHSRRAHVIRCCRNFLVTMSDLGRGKMSVSLCSCSARGGASSVGGVLSEDRLGDVSVVFNPTCPSRIGPITRFTGGGGVQLMMPFASGKGRIFDGPTVCRVGAPRSCLCSRICRRFAHGFAATGIVFLSTRSNSGSGISFVGKLGRRLGAGHVPFARLGKRGVAPRSLGNTVGRDVSGMFVPASNAGITLVGLLPRLVIASHSGPSCHVRLFNCPR